MIDTRLYGVWEGLLRGEQMSFVVEDLTMEQLAEMRIGLENLVTDTIETPITHSMVYWTFRDYNKTIRLSLPDTMVNLCLWGLVLEPGGIIKPKHVFFCKKGINKGAIADYINKFCIIPNRDTVDSVRLNSIIYNNHRLLHFAEKWAMYFNNSINMEDFILLANACPEFDMLMHKSYANLPADQMNAEAQKDCDRMIEIILESKKWIGRDHCLADAFRAKVGVKPKQFREMISNIGIKPNGEGGIFPHSIDSTYMNGGLSRYEWMVADASIGRQAQILSKQNTADSGAFARVLGLNQLDTSLYTDPHTHRPDATYDCHTKNFVEVLITPENIEMYSDRYYRLHPNGIEYNTGSLDTLDRSLIGKTIYLRSPMTCASAAKGFGICRKCYGDLFMTNVNVNIGKIAAEFISQILTQLMLSAKHLLEAKISKLKWNIEDFDAYFTFEDETISINQDFLCSKKWLLHIDRDQVNIQTIIGMNDDGGGEDEGLDIIREYITSFDIITDEGEVINVHGMDNENLYITEELAKIINSKQYADDNDVFVEIATLQASDTPIFSVAIYNDDLGKNLKDIMSIINLKSKTCSYDRHQFLREFVNKMIECNMSAIRSVHAEIILMNQIRDPDDMLDKPEWDFPDAPYRIVTLRQALEYNPSILVSMQYEHLSRVLYKPISFKKKAPSRVDLLFHVNPQQYVSQEVEIPSEPKSPFVRVEQ